MRQDVDVSIQRPGTYREAVNMEIFHNRGGADNLGASFAVTNSRGNKLSFSLPNGYYPVNAVELDDQIIIFSTNDHYSQIGVAFGKGDELVYQILFDDRNDPNGDLLDFFVPSANEGYMSVAFSKENEYIERVYFADGRNQDRVINLRSMYLGWTCDFSAPQSNVPIHDPNQSNPSSSNRVYPRYMSVHAMDNIMDVTHPEFTFQQRIQGNLKRGAYQFAVRYISSGGHASVWSIPTRHVLVTGTHFQNNPEFLNNHHNREMGTTDSEAITEDGLRIRFDGLDTRWCGFEIAFIYSKTDKISNEAIIVYRHDSQCGVNPVPSSFTYDFVSHTGIPFALDELLTRNEVIMSSRSIRMHERTMYRFGASILGDFDLNLSGASVKTKFKYIKADETIEPRFTNIANARTGRGDNDPLTNTPIETTTIPIQKFTGVTKNYPVVNDYLGYKGQQVEHLLPQYMGGETYGIAVVVIDRKGNPLFAQPISDITIPENFSSIDGEECTLTKKIGDTWKLRIKGLEVSGIKIPKKGLRDRYGKLNISGFMIVRTDRSGSILHQGVVVPVVETKIGAGSSLQTNVQVKPYPLLTTDFEGPYRDGTSHYVKTTPEGEYLAIRDEVENENFIDRLNAIAGYSLYFSPDVMIEGQHEFNSIDSIKHVASYYRAYNSDTIRLVGDQLTGDGTQRSRHVYGKFYDGSLVMSNGDPELYEKYGRRKIGETSRLKFAKLVTDYNTKIEAFDDDATEWEFKNGDVNIGLPLFSDRWKVGKGVGARFSVLMGMLDFEHVDLRFGLRKAGYRVVNYIRPSSRYLSGNDTGIDARLYKPTGHYQPINEQVLSQVADDGENYVFNGIEVWGGDTFVNLFDFTRMVPNGSRNCDNTKTFFTKGSGDRVNYLSTPDGLYPEYATSMIIPIESKYNLALRFGRRFARNATYPQNTYCDDRNNQFSGGIMSFQPESFAINPVLLHSENIVFFGVKPRDLGLIKERFNTIYYGDDKILGERLDTFRSQKVNNFYDIDGNCGRIVGTAQAFSYIYVIFERGYGILRARQIASAATDIGEIVLGTGKDVNGVDFVSTDIGCQHPKSIISRRNYVSFVDARNQAIIRHSQAGSRDLTRDQFLREYSRVFTEVSDIISGYDPDNGNLYITMFGNNSIKKTIVYNERVGFMDLMTMQPFIYCTLAARLFVAPRSERGSFYITGKGDFGDFSDGSIDDSSITFIVNTSPGSNKIFDNMTIVCEQGAYDNLKEIIFDTETGRKVINKSNCNIKYDRGRIRFPIMEKSSRERLRGRYAIVKMVFSNMENRQLVINSVETKMRPEL